MIKIIIPIVMLLFLHTNLIASQQSNQELLSCAEKALNGDFGKLKPWQKNAYERAITKGSRSVTAWITCYFPSEGFKRNQGCAYGYGCSEEIAAANEIKGRTVIWVRNPSHLRVIGDTGAHFNDAIARRKGASLWCDIWVPFVGWKGLPESGIGTIHIIKS